MTSQRAAGDCCGPSWPCWGTVACLRPTSQKSRPEATLLLLGQCLPCMKQPRAQAPSGTAPQRKDLEEAARLRTSEGRLSLLTWVPVTCYLLEKGFLDTSWSSTPGLTWLWVGAELRFSQGTKIGKRGTGGAKQDRRQKSLENKWPS